MNTWYLEISTYAGIAPLAKHWCGRLVGPLVPPSIARGEYELGAHDKRSEAIRAGTEKFDDMSEAGDLLVLGSHCTCDPNPILRGPRMKEANILCSEFRRMGCWDLDPTRAGEVAQKWCDLWDMVDNGATQDATPPPDGALCIVFDGPPSGGPPPRFVECEVGGKSRRVGDWHKRDDGLWELRIKVALDRGARSEQPPPEDY